jgi:integrase
LPGYEGLKNLRPAILVDANLPEGGQRLVRLYSVKKGQQFGFHNFRHGLASWLVNQGTDVKTVQGLLRHSNVSTTLGLYAHRVNSSMLAAQDSMMRALQTGSQTVQ